MRTVPNLPDKMMYLTIFGKLGSKIKTTRGYIPYGSWLLIEYYRLKELKRKVEIVEKNGELALAIEEPKINSETKEYYWRK